MARGKKGKKSVRNTQSQAPDTKKVESASSETVVTSKGRFSLLDYFIICVLFVAFCYVQKYVALWFLESGVVSTIEELEENALDFFFDTMWQGFLIVAVLVGIHDFFYRGEEEEDHMST